MRDDTFPPFDVRPRTDGSGDETETVEIDAEVLADVVNTLYEIEGMDERDYRHVAPGKIAQARKQLEREIPDLQTHE